MTFVDVDSIDPDGPNDIEKYWLLKTDGQLLGTVANPMTQPSNV